MATWNPPADVDLGVGKPGKPSLVRAIRDLPSALAERASGAPWLNGIGALIIFNRAGYILSQPPWSGEYSLEATWVVPANVYRLDATIVGGGGSGGDGNSNSTTGFEAIGGGGGGAGAVNRLVIDVEPDQVYQIKIGAGGRLEAVHPSVDTGLDGFEIGDGARTAFGPFVAAGGQAGHRGSLGGGGGTGGGQTDGGNPTYSGADGKPALNVDTYNLGQLRSGSGAPSTFGGGAPGRNDVGDGYSAFDTILSIYGSGGGGGHPVDGILDSKDGGRGANGVVIVRY